MRMNFQRNKYLQQKMPSDLQIYLALNKDYKSNVYKVTDNIEIPVRIGNKQTQQGSSWWLSSKEFPKVFMRNLIISHSE